MRSASEEPFSHQLENGWAIWRDYFQPRQFSHHREIDAAETEASEEDVDAVTERLVIERLDRLCQCFGAVGVGPTVFHFGVSFSDAHLQRRVGHGERNELLPVAGAGEATRGLPARLERGW